METITLDAVTRESGKSAARSIRREGNVPAVLYGRGFEPISLQVSEAACKKFIFSDRLNRFEINIDGKSYPCIAKMIDFHPVDDSPRHIDFQLLVDSEEIRTSVPIHISGTPIGVTNGGALKKIIHQVEIECLPENLPAFIAADVTALRIGGVLRVADVQLDGVKILSPASQAIAMVITIRAEVLIEDEDEEEDEDGEGGEEESGDSE